MNEFEKKVRNINKEISRLKRDTKFLNRLRNIYGNDENAQIQLHANSLRNLLLENLDIQTRFSEIKNQTLNLWRSVENDDNQGIITVSYLIVKINELNI